MSFLSILLFISAFYFAHGRPDAVAVAQADDAPVPSEESDKIKEQIDSFIKEISDALDKYIVPLMSKLDKDDQQKMKTIAMNACNSYINNMIAMTKLKQGDDSVKSSAYNPMGDQDDIMIEFEDMGPLDTDSGFIPAEEPTPNFSSAKTEVFAEDKDFKSFDMPEAEEP